MSKHEFQGINTIQIVNIPLIPEGYLKLILEENYNGKVACITMSEETKDAVVKFKYEQGIFIILDCNLHCTEIQSYEGSLFFYIL